MADDRISVPYNQNLKPLEDVLAGARRPGDFFVQGSLEAPMPRVEVEGVGVLSFPVLNTQIQELIQHAARAPYGRGEETILDESVRKVWQLTPDQVRLGGRAWEKSFADIASTVKKGLGCEDYKLLVYDEGGFFKPHRDTEKTEGMFGTLVIVLPSEHRGGELVIRHAGREVAVNLVAEEVSELKFAAFYADCQHEVRPITKGNRVCLVYNLIQRQSQEKPLTAPLYDAETASAAKLLDRAFADSAAPAKLAWLLEHEYSPAGLSFTGLKGADSALAKVLRAAAEQAGCAVHLGIVHIEESGPAQPNYDPYDRRSRWGRRDYEEKEEDAGSGDYEVVEVSDSSQYLDQWIDAQDRPVKFGKLPLHDGEVLPAGALDDEEPDEQRLTEATGNEGASFERSYHRAALVIWPLDRFTGVLLQAGVGAALPYLSERIQACNAPPLPKAERQSVISIARRIVEAWEAPPDYRTHVGAGRERNRSEMIQLLGELGDDALLQRFVCGVVTCDYDGSENEALAANLALLDAKTAGQLLSQLARENMRWFHWAIVNLLSRLIREHETKPEPAWMAALREMGAAIVEALPRLETAPARDASHDWQRAQKAKPVDAVMVADLFTSLGALDAAALREAASTAITENARVFDPGTVIVPALAMLHERAGKLASEDELRLWRHAADFLLARSEHPPEPPRDWRQDVKISCKCEDCRELQVFVLDPAAQVARFRVRQDRRQHLHWQIEHHDLDMTHVTERKGSPQTLVCTKTRRTYERQCTRHQADCASMTTLLHLLPGACGEAASLPPRLAAARELKPEN
jgi:hypothetical protein